MIESFEYFFAPSLAQLIELKGIPASEKLRWLDEAHSFFSKFMTVEDVERWKKIVNGEQQKDRD